MRDLARPLSLAGERRVVGQGGLRTRLYTRGPVPRGLRFLRLPPALVLTVVWHLHLEPGERRPLAVWRDVVHITCERGGGRPPPRCPSSFEYYYGMVTVVASPALLMVKVPVAAVVA